MATSNKGPGSRTQSYTKRGLTRADIARLKKIRDKPSPKGTTMAKTDITKKYKKEIAKLQTVLDKSAKDKFTKKRKVIGGLKAAAKKHGSKIAKAAGSAILGTISTFGPGKKLGMAVKGVKLAGKGAKSAAAGYVKLKSKIAKLKKGETTAQLLKRKNKLSGVYGGKAAVAGGATAALGAAAVGERIQRAKLARDKKKKTARTMEKARDKKPSGRLTYADLKKNKRTPMDKIESGLVGLDIATASPAIKAAYKLARSRKPSGRLNKDDIDNAKEAMKLYGVKKARDKKPSGRLTSDDIKGMKHGGRAKSDNIRRNPGKPGSKMEQMKEHRESRRAIKKASPGGGRSRRS
tara:strand:- start:1827 stop:2873 length:1047 start_codon:yes stop_codon:yes gene_type:complete